MATISFWERESFLSGIDLAIIGSGIVGLSAAIAFKEKFPKKKVVVLERGFLPFGASSKNAGFACFGSVTELLDDFSRMPENEVLSLVEKRWKGLQELRTMLGDSTIGYENNGGFELFTQSDLETYNKAKQSIEDLNQKLAPIVGYGAFSHADERIVDFDFKNTTHLILNRYEAQIDTGRMMASLLQKAREAGIEIFNGITIKSIEDAGGSVSLNTSCGKLRASRCLVATNGLTKTLLPELTVEPARAQVLITKPISGLKLKGTFHYEQGYYYFRNVGSRVLLGGGRNLDFVAENTTEIALTELIQNRLNDLLRSVILPNTPYEVDMRWAGVMGVSKSKSTIQKHLSDNVYCAVRLGGMGVAIGSLIGKEAIENFYN